MYGWRGLRRSPAFTVVAVLSLAVGIGANAVIFGLIHSLMLARLPVVRPSELRLVARDVPFAVVGVTGASYEGLTPTSPYTMAIPVTTMSLLQSAPRPDSVRDALLIVMAFHVSARAREIGVRLALGAGRGHVVSMVVRRALVLVAMGVVIGVPIALAGARSLGALLYGSDRSTRFRSRQLWRCSSRSEYWRPSFHRGGRHGSIR